VKNIVVKIEECKIEEFFFTFSEIFIMYFFLELGSLTSDFQPGRSIHISNDI